VSSVLTSRNPTTGEVVAEYPVFDAERVDAAIVGADTRQRAWRRTSFDQRAEMLRAAASLLESRADQLAELMATEMGKPVTAGRQEAEKCAWACRYYADHGAEHLADVHVETDHRRSYVHHEPLGVVLAVMPWNFPLWQVFRFAAPALMAGNGAVLKHASNVTGASLAIAEILEAAGAPPGLFASLVIPSADVAAVIDHPLVRAVTLTGSGPAGRAVAGRAGSELKKTVLELGGSDPYVVLADADVGRAAAVCARSRLINSGQSCIAAKRFVVVDAVHDEFVELLDRELARSRLGDPLDEATDIGPQARHDLRDELHRQVESSLDAGARLVRGGVVPEGPGAFYPATILTEVEPGMVAADEELFGPVAAVMRAAGTDEAVAIANTTSFGLGAAVFTADLALGEEIAATRLEAGTCTVNTLVASDPRLPFGGIGESGYGRELAGQGIREFTNVKTVVVA
jgi:succinate-semialdehyde dehydrogenase/glutarate-semialdehyde dehydrogenase